MNKSIHLSIGFMFCIMFCLLASGNVLAQEKHVAAGTDLSLYLDPDGNVWTMGRYEICPGTLTGAFLI